MDFLDVTTAYRKVNTVAICCFVLSTFLGETVKTTGQGRVHVFPFNSSLPDGPMRTDSLIRQHAAEAHGSGSHVSGTYTVCHV